GLLQGAPGAETRNQRPGYLVHCGRGPVCDCRQQSAMAQRGNLRNMNTIRLYGLKRCSTCVKAMSWLQEQGIAYEFTDDRDQPVPASTLSDWQAQLGGWEKLVNRASMTWRNLPDERKTPQGDEQWLGLIAEFPALIKR